jgi:hypothetical protein
MVPGLPAFVWRAAAAFVAAAYTQALDAEHHPAQCQHERHTGSPHDCLPPRPGVFAQRGEIEPMDDGTGPVPRPFAAAGVAHQLSGAARNVQHIASVIAHGHAMQRAVRGHPAKAPLVEIDLLNRPRYGVAALACARLRRGAPGSARAYVTGAGGSQGAGNSQRCAGIGPHRHRRAGCAATRLSLEMVGGAAGHAGQADRGRHTRLARCLPRRPRADADRVRIERRQPLLAFSFSERWVWHVHHHHARTKPQQYQQTKRNAQPAVPQVQLAFQ